MNKIKHFSILVLLLLLVTNSKAYAQQNSYSINVGDAKVTALLDGTVDIDVNNLFDSHNNTSAQTLIERAYLHNPVEVSINVYLVQYDTKNILIDTGAGTIFGEYAGNLSKSLLQIGLLPTDITDILITHIHADHTGGMVVNNKRVFTNAIIHVNQYEYDFWINGTAQKNANAGADATTFNNAEKMMKPYFESRQIKTFKNTTTDLFPILKAIPLTGHTPGHTVYHLESKGEQMYFWGDLVHVESVQFTDPLMTDHFDVDQNQAKDTRATFYEEVAHNQALIGASHISFPGIGRLKKENTKYLWVPVPYSVKGRTR